MANDDDEDDIDENGLDLDDDGPESDDDEGGDADGDSDDEPESPGSSDPFADDDDDDLDFSDEDGPEEDNDDDFDFPSPGDDDDEYEDFDDDDYDDMPDLGDFSPGDGGGFAGGLKEKLSGLSGGMIALVASGGVFLLVLIVLVTWLSLSFDEEAHEKGSKKVEVVTSLAGLEPAAQPKSKKKTKPAPKKAEKPDPKKPDSADGKSQAASGAKPAGKTADVVDKAGKSKKPGSDKEDPKKADGAKEGDKPDEKKDGEQPAESIIANIDPALIDQTPDGPLPVIAPDGRQAWQVYARPFKPAEEDKKAGKVALVIAGLGLSKTQTQAAIQQMPGEVTLSFAPYARNLGEWILEARAAGHEVVLEVPMEPKDYPNNDPGPHTLLTSKGPTDNIDNLNWLLSRFPGYVGITNFLGEKFTANEEAMLPILKYLKKRGLMYLDSKASRKSVGARMAKEIKMPRAYNTRFIDKEASRVSIDARLFELERIAKSTGAAVGIGFPLPVTLERLKVWMADMKKKNIILVPLSAVANLQTIR